MIRLRLTFILMLIGIALGLLAVMLSACKMQPAPTALPIGPATSSSSALPTVRTALPLTSTPGQPPIATWPTTVEKWAYMPFVSQWKVSPLPTVAPTPILNVPNVIIPKNLGGLHVEGTGDHTGYEEFLAKCSADNRPVALIKVFGDGYSAKIAKEIDPRTVTIWRKPPKVGHDEYADNPPGDWNWPPAQTAEIARKWLESMYPDWANQREYIDYFEVVNEPNMATVTQTLHAADFMLEVMKLAESHDPPYRLAIWSFSSGTPEPWQAQLISHTLRYAAEHGHILSVHDGSVDDERRLFRQAQKDGTAFRYRMFQPLLGKSMPRVAVTEAYQPDGYHNPDWADWQWYLTEMAKDDYAIGVAWFTLGPYSFGGGQEVNVVKQLPAFTLALGCR